MEGKEVLMKLRSIIKKIAEYSKKRPSLEEFIDGQPILLVRAISSYLDNFFLSKGEAKELFQSLEDEICYLRNEIEELKSEMDYQSAIDEPYAGGLSPEELVFLDEMIAEEYFCKANERE